MATLLALALASRAEPTKPVRLDGVAAQVGEHVITLGDALAVMEPVQRQLTGSYSGAELRDKLRKAYEAALNSLIERWLILDAYAQGDSKISDKAVDARIQEIVHERFHDDRGELMAILSRERLTFEDWRKEIRDGLVVMAMRRSSVDDKVRVPAADVRAQYETNRAAYRRPEEVKLRMLVLKKGSSADDTQVKRRQAEDIKKRLAAKEDFAALATSLSEDAKAAEGGDWGWVEPKTLRPELAAAIRELKPGDVSDAVETRDELYIVKLEGRKEEAVASFDDVHADIERKMKQERAQKLYDEWVRQLRDKAYVKVFDIDLPE
jgi:peptidyl-prolyl cis-trans isomerase SurA